MSNKKSPRNISQDTNEERFKQNEKNIEKIAGVINLHAEVIKSLVISLSNFLESFRMLTQKEKEEEKPVRQETDVQPVEQEKVNDPSEKDKTNL